ncbi:MAG: hypothetical protein R3E93_00075 [Thiothrix sp.]
MPTKDPITIVGLLATIMLATGAAMLYLPPELQPLQPQKPQIVFSSPFKDPAPAKVPAQVVAQPPPITPAPPVTPVQPATAPPPLALPSLSDTELAELTPAEREHYNNMRQSLQQVLQQVETLTQANADLQQTIEQSSAKNEQLDSEIDKLRANQGETGAAQQ